MESKVAQQASASSFSASACSRLPRASACLGQSAAAWAALAIPNRPCSSLSPHLTLTPNPNPNPNRPCSPLSPHRRGAFLTIDRPYPPLIDWLHHRIGTTHVAHHIDCTIPHYRAQEVTLTLNLNPKP
eukprot:scaffold61941_cov57-Phaeocystis_antarctica.AAC.1